MDKKRLEISGMLVLSSFIGAFTSNFVDDLLKEKFPWNVIGLIIIALFILALVYYFIKYIEKPSNDQVTPTEKIKKSRIVYWLLSSLIFALFIRITTTTYTRVLIFVILSTLAIFLDYQIFNRKRSLWIIPTAVLAVTIPILSLQATTPIFAPIMDMSMGETKYGFIYGDHTSTWREFKIDIHPPLFLTNIDGFNCRMYNIVTASRGHSDASLEPLKVVNLINPDPELKDFYKTIKLCWNSDAKIDAWKLGKISTSVYLESIQPVWASITGLPAERGMNNDNYITQSLEIENNVYSSHIDISNWESYPIIFWTNLWIKNDSQAYTDIREMVSSKPCNRFVIYSVPNDNASKIINSIEFDAGTVLGNYSINLGYTSGFLNIDRLEPLENKRYQIRFACKSTPP